MQNMQRGFEEDRTSVNLLAFLTQYFFDSPRFRKRKNTFLFFFCLMWHLTLEISYF
jgi:hypothetical protein